MKLEDRAGEDMSAKANMPHANASAGTTPFHGVHASPDVRAQAFGNQPHCDMRLHAIANQHHPSSADIQALATRRPVCPVTTHGQVMTDEQLETLRRQISVYATICEQLVEMHKAIMAQQSATSGLWLGASIPFDSSVHSIGHKLTSRQRWTPSQTQLHILERLFEEESGTPNKQRIKEITIELSQHGQISETNVYNWFQNRRARTKRKQQLGGPGNGDSELDTDVDLPEEKKSKTNGDFIKHSFDSAPACGAPNIEHYQELSDLSQRHAHPNSTAISLNKLTFNGHGELQASHFIDSKLWDLPMNQPESKSNFSGFSKLQEFQGRQMVITGAGSRH